MCLRYTLSVRVRMRLPWIAHLHRCPGYSNTQSRIWRDCVQQLNKW